jgi:membrane-associated phospholipid phosphatase
MMTVFTDFGDPAVLLPLSGAILIWLLATHAARGALWWLAAVVACTGGTGLLKIYFFACPIAQEVMSPSGHTSFSTLVYSALAVIIAPKMKSAWRQAMVLAAATLLILAVAVSRFALNVHTFPEVVLGILLGMASLGLFARHYLRLSPSDASLRPLLVAVVLVVAVLHGREVHAEPLLHALSSYFHLGSHACA